MNRNSFYTGSPEDFWRMVDSRSPEECWPWMGAKKKEGYGRVRLDCQPMTASRCAWILQNGNPGSLHVLHSCHNPVCVNPSHLHVGTLAQNMEEMALAGRAHRAFGRSNGNARLTEEIVRAVRADPRPQKEIMATYGIGSSTVSQIKTRKRWAHLEDL